MINKPTVPFLDLVAPHEELRDELVSVFRGALQSGSFIGGPIVQDFEKQFAEFCGVEHCVGVGSGTDALRFALIAAGVKPGDTVVTVPNTFIATTEAISQAGARPDFIDIHERTYNMDPQRLQEYLADRCFFDKTTGRVWNRETRSAVSAIVPVHLYGQVADMDAILQVAAQYNITVVEDACQAHGAEYFSRIENRWKRAGSFGAAAAFSFYPGKNLGACGEAGAVTTRDPMIASRIRMLRDHGQLKKYEHQIEGYNGRLDTIQAGILLAKLKHLAEWNDQRRAHAQRYDELLRSLISVTLPYEPVESKSVYHLYVIRSKNRNQLQTRLASANIATLIHYPTPLHLQKPYTHLGYGVGDFPITEAVAAEILSIPMYPQMTPAQQMYVARRIREAISTRRLREIPGAQPAYAA